MPFLHVFCKKSSFGEGTQYVMMAEPGIDEEVTKVVREVFGQFCDVGLRVTERRISVDCVASRLPGNLADKSLVVLVLLEKLDKLGWALVAGETIHDEHGMIFRKMFAPAYWNQEAVEADG